MDERRGERKKEGEGGEAEKENGEGSRRERDRRGRDKTGWLSTYPVSMRSYRVVFMHQKWASLRPNYPSYMILRLFVKKKGEGGVRGEGWWCSNSSCLGKSSLPTHLD